MKELEKNEKILLICIIIGLIIVFIVKLLTRSASGEELDKSIKIVTDQNRFFEVSSCINKYIQYSQNQEYDKLFSIINEDYKEKNNIDINNVFSFFKQFGVNDVFSARKMYYQQLDSGIYKYYVYGYYREELMDSIGENKEYYIIVYLYTDNMTFSIEPYDGELFEG